MIPFFLTLLILLTNQSSSSLLDPQLPIPIPFENIPFPSTSKAFLVLTDQSEFLGSTFGFQEQSRSSPRIISVVDFTSIAISGLPQNIPIPPFQISEPRTLTVHYIEAKPSSTPVFKVTGFLDRFTYDFPDFGDQIARTSTLHSAFGDLKQYQTMILSIIITHDIPEDLVCEYQFLYTGVVRGVIFNDDHKGNWKGSGVDLQDMNYAHNFVHFKAGEPMWVTITGKCLDIQSFTITGCTANGQPVDPNFIYSYPDSSIKLPTDVDVVANTTYCEENALRCINSTYSLQCAQYYVRENGKCKRFCDDREKNVNRFGDCVLAEFEDYGVGGYEVTPSSRSFLLRSTLDLLWGNNFIALLNPGLLIHGSIPLIFESEKIDPSFQTSQVFLLSFPGDLDWSSFTDLKPAGDTGLDAFKLNFQLFEIVDDPDKTMLVRQYSSKPSQISEFQNYDNFHYAMFDDLHTLDRTKYYNFDTFLNCIEACEISFIANGNVKVFENLQTLLVDVTFEDKPAKIPISKMFVGVVLLNFQVSRSSSFQLVVSSTWFSAFTNSFMRLSVTLMLDGTVEFPCTNPNCLSCEGNICLSCPDGYFLSSMNTCETSCPLFKNVFERKCISFCPPNMVPGPNNVCLPRCSESGKFFIEDKGCEGNCSVGCNTCPSATECTTCKSGTTLLADKTCQCNTQYKFYVEGQGCVGPCPFKCKSCQNGLKCLDCDDGTTNVGGFCQCNAPKVRVGNRCKCSLGYIEDPTDETCQPLTGSVRTRSMELSKGSDLLLWSNANLQKNQLFSSSFLWTFTSNTANQRAAVTLETYLKTQTTKVLYVPQSYFEVGTTYSFASFSQDSTGITLIEVVTVLVTNQLRPQVQISGGGYRNYTGSETILLRADILPSIWAFNPSSFSIKWSKTTGTLLAPITFKDQLWLEIPPCRLRMGETYGFQVSVGLRNSALPPSTSEITITIPIELDLTIPDQLRTHYSNKDLSLTPSLSLKENCKNTYFHFDDLIDAALIEYTWTCVKVNNAGVEIPCLDPLNLFGLKQTSIDLNLPRSYFEYEAGNEFIFQISLVAPTYNNELIHLNARANVQILDPSKTKISLKCSNIQNCVYASNTLETEFSVEFEGFLDSALTYKWKVNPPIPYYSYLNSLKLYGSPLQFRSSGLETLTVTLEIDNNSDMNEVFFRIPLNMEPTGGILEVFPKTGNSLSTNFYLSATGWTDEDSILTYRFFYSFDSNGEYIDLTSQQNDPFTFTQLIRPVSGSTVYLKVVVSDSLNASSTAFTTVTVTKPATEGNTTEEVQKSLDTLLSINPFESFQKLLMLLQDLSNRIDNLKSQVTNGCPRCSGNGICVSGKCQCDKGFEIVSDCSVAVSTFEEIVWTQDYLIQKASAAFATIYKLRKDDRVKEMFMRTMTLLSRSADFTNNATLAIFQGVLEPLIKDVKEIVTLQEGESIQLIDTLNNFWSFAAERDCGVVTEFTNNLENITNDYFGTVSRSMAAQRMLTEPAFAHESTNFDVLTQKVPLCELSKLSFETGTDRPIVQIFPKSSTSNFDNADCLIAVNVKYYTFRKHIFNCTVTEGRLLIEEKPKSIVAFELELEESELDDQDFEAVVQISKGETCQKGCEPFEGSQILCKCQDLEALSLKNVLSNLFAESRAHSLGDLSGLNFRIWENVAVWSLMTFTTWFFFTIFYVKKATPYYCILEQLRMRQRTARLKLKLLLLTTHPLAGIYLYRSPYITKARRAFLYYVRITLLLVYSSLFANLNGRQEIQLDYILFNYITVSPLYYVLYYLLQGIQENELDTSKKLMFKKFVGTFFGIGVTLTCIVVTFIISAQFTNTQMVNWAIGLGISLIQDTFVSPFLILFIRLLLIQIWTHSVKTGYRRVAIVLSKLINIRLMKLYDSIFRGAEISKVKSYESPFKTSASSKLQKLSLRIVPIDSKEIYSMPSPQTSSAVLKNQENSCAPPSSKALDPLLERENETIGDAKLEISKREKSEDKDQFQVSEPEQAISKREKLQLEERQDSQGQGEEQETKQSPVIKYVHPNRFYKNLLRAGSAELDQKNTGSSQPRRDAFNLALEENESTLNNQTSKILKIFMKQEFEGFDSPYQLSINTFDFSGNDSLSPFTNSIRPRIFEAAGGQAYDRTKIPSKVSLGPEAQKKIDEISPITYKPSLTPQSQLSQLYKGPKNFRHLINKLKDDSMRRSRRSNGTANAKAHTEMSAKDDTQKRADCLSEVEIERLRDYLEEGCKKYEIEQGGIGAIESLNIEDL